MGNRAVIVTEDTTRDNVNAKIGVYVHWYGSQDEVQHVLDLCKEKHVRNYKDDDLYFWARFCQLFADYITKESRSDKEDYEAGIGIGIVSNLDCANVDNGVYYVNDEFEIVKHTNGCELLVSEQVEKKQAWLVTQTQRDNMYDHTPIYTTENYDEAVECARMLNKQFGRGCIFTPEGDYEYEVADSEYAHFYKVESTKIGIDLNNVLFEKPTTQWVIEMFMNETHCGWLADEDEKCITQSYKEAKVFDDYAEAVRFTLENSEANSGEYCVCPID